jgi:hypothetical protein
MPSSTEKESCHCSEATGASRGDLEAPIWSGYTPGEQKVFLAMMESCGICFKVRELPNDPQAQSQVFLSHRQARPLLCLSMRRVLWRLFGFLVPNWSSMAM